MKICLFAIILMSMMAVSIPTAFAERTDDGQFDFMFPKVDIYQNPNNLNKLIIIPFVHFQGTEPVGSILLDITITNPDGSEFPLSGRISDIVTNTNKSIPLEYSLPSEGTYQIQIVMDTSSTDHPDHTFQTWNSEYTVEPRGLEKMLDYVERPDDDGNAVYMLRHSEVIQNFERLHLVFDFPDDFAYSDIVITNNDFKEIFDIDTDELFLKSEFGYSDVEVYLVREGNLLEFVDAQSEFLNYVTFYAIHEDVCWDKECQSIDYVETTSNSEDTLLWIIAIVVVVIVVIGIFVSKKYCPKIKSDIWGEGYASK